jgi:hypothetical protein
MSEIITVGLDLAKNVFQVHGAGGAARSGPIPLDTIKVLLEPPCQSTCKTDPGLECLLRVGPLSRVQDHAHHFDPPNPERKLRRPSRRPRRGPQSKARRTARCIVNCHLVDFIE